MRILFYAKSPDATEVYRVLIPAKYLRRMPGVEVKTNYGEKHPQMPEAGVKFSDVEWADVIVFQRPATEVVLNIIKIIKQKHPGKKVLLDYDDDYFSVPSWNPGYPFIRINDRWWPQFPDLCDGIITSTEPLAQVYRKRTKKPVKVISNGFDFESFDESQPLKDLVIENPGFDKKANRANVNYRLDLAQFRSIMEDRRLVTWAGSRFHFVDLDWIADDIRKVIRERTDVNFMFVSYCQANILRDLPPNRLYTTPGLSPVSAFYALLKTLNSDVMLAPLDPCCFNQSKSNLKILEMMALRAYPVCSAWDPYEDDLDPELNKDTTHGLLVGYEPGDWYKAINEALERSSDKSFQAINDAYVRSTHDAANRSQMYLDFFSQLEKT